MNEKAQPLMRDLKGTHYISYLLRLWRTEELQGFDWRASLEIPATFQGKSGRISSLVAVPPPHKVLVPRCGVKESAAMEAHGTLHGLREQNPLTGLRLR